MWQKKGIYFTTVFDLGYFTVSDNKLFQNNEYKINLLQQSAKFLKYKPMWVVISFCNVVKQTKSLT